MTTIQMLDLVGYGANVYGHPIHAVDVRVAHNLVECGARDLPAVAGVLAETFAGALDTSNNGDPAGDLYYTVVSVVTRSGVTKLMINAERTEQGYAVYYPTLTGPGQSGLANPTGQDE